jgi:6-pyruvoyltetrahydropterin/6-carboxytetrahydropterin synthase
MNKELNKEQWTIIKEIEIAISHKLDLDYISKCNELHGHNLKIKVFMKMKKKR